MKKQFTLQITPKVLEQVKGVAKENGLSASAYIEQVLRKDLNEQK
ncbi:DUF6364 family protein [Gottfriedia acidiceleris]